ncbi:hypothetical protein ABIA14_000469 [Sinorhizobium fredii]
MTAGVERGAHRGDIRRHAGRGFIMRHEDGLDLVRLVGGEPLGVELDRHAGAPFPVEAIDLEAEALGHVDPEMRELAEAAHQHLVAGGEHIGHRRFPGAGAGRGIDEDAAVPVLEDLLDVGEKRQGQLRKARGAHVFHRQVHRLANLLGNVGGAWNEEMVVA